MTRSELVARYGVRDRLALSLLLPYDSKAQTVRYSTLNGTPYLPPYGDIHHRTETLRGIADGELLLLWAPAAGGPSEWRLGIGATLPLGTTVADPIDLGRRGVKHEHLQFGSGVIAPQFEAAWSRRFNTVTGTALVQATIPVTTNSHGFRAPRSYRWSLGPSFDTGTISVALKAAGQYQTIGRWNGEIDEGTGFSNAGLRLQLSVPWRSLTIEPSVYRELYSHGLHDQSFSQGTTLALGISRTF
jgi:hypothetical protein